MVRQIGWVRRGLLSRGALFSTGGNHPSLQTLVQCGRCALGAVRNRRRHLGSIRPLVVPREKPYDLMSVRLLVLPFVAVFVLAACGPEEEAEPERMAEEHEGDTPMATEATQAPRIPVTENTVAYTEMPGGDSVMGYVAAPANPDSVLEAKGRDPATAQLPGIVVIHEWWGLNDNVRAATRRLAGEGYRALAVDVYRGAVAETPDSAQALMQRAMSESDRVQANLQAAYDYLRSEMGAPRVAVLGWCFGGSRTFEVVSSSPTQYSAAVAYYGSPGSMTDSVLQSLTTPVLAHFGREDEAIGMEAVRSLRSRLENVDAPVTVHLYDAGHAFANPSGESYDADAATTAWGRTTEFLQQHLYPASKMES